MCADRIGLAVELALDGVALPGQLAVPASAAGLVIFAHGSGSGRLSPRNVSVSRALHARGLATLLFDLLTESESRDRENVFDIPLLGARLAAATAWARERAELREMAVGYFGASTGAAAALWAATELLDFVGAVVSRGGRPDLAAERLPAVRCPTLLIVGGADHQVLELNRRAQSLMTCESELVIVPGATHLFEEEGALEQVAINAGEWFARHLSREARP